MQLTTNNLKQGSNINLSYIMKSLYYMYSRIGYNLGSMHLFLKFYNNRQLIWYNVKKAAITQQIK